MHNGECKILIVDDEPPARARLTAMVGDIGGWSVVAEAVNGTEAIELSQQHQPDVILLDIRMPGMDGMEVASHLCHLEAPPAVIFTTAYDEYAVKAFETHAVGYLLKPVRQERLMRALEQAVRLGQMKLAELAQADLGNQNRSRIPVTQAGKVLLVPADSIIAFRADHKYVQMLYEQEGEVRESLIDEPLKDLEEEFSADFIRVHRNALVRTDRIAAVEKFAGSQHEVVLQGYPARLPVSRRHYSTLKQRLKA